MDNTHTAESAPTDSPTPHYGGFWMRLLAFIIDNVILAIISSIFFGDAVVSTTASGLSVHYNGIYMLLPMLYTILFWKFAAATPGKMLLGLKVATVDDSPLTWSTVIIRLLGYIPSSLVFCLGFIWIAFDPKKQGWHDKMAKTVVLKK